MGVWKWTDRHLVTLEVSSGVVVMVDMAVLLLIIDMEDKVGVVGADIE